MKTNLVNKYESVVLWGGGCSRAGLKRDMSKLMGWWTYSVSFVAIVLWGYGTPKFVQ